jgi:predicted NBD/HSP70 family sugar kinase
MHEVTFTTGGALKKSALRQANERLVLNVVRQNPLVSRADIVRITGLSPSSVTFIVQRLERQKMLCEEASEPHAKVGRQPMALRLCPQARLAIGVEVTLSGARIAVTGMNDEIVTRKTVARHDNYSLFFGKVNSVLRSLLESMAPGQALGVGVALPGLIDEDTGRVLAAENFNWIGVDAGALLRRDLAVPFYFENTARLAALAEMWSSERGPNALRHFVSITARGGLGTGVIIDGQLLRGASSSGAEFGHIALYPEGRRCSCGNTGCWEQYASDLALARAYCDESGKDRTEADAEAIVAMARTGDAVAHHVLIETARHVGLGFVNLIMALNPQAIVLGDYLAESWDLIKDTVWPVLRGRVAPYYLSGLRIFPSRHGAESSLRGAIALVFGRFFGGFGDENGSQSTNSVRMRG